MYHISTDFLKTAIKRIKYRALLCKEDRNILPLQSIRNNIEAFQNYPSLESGQFQLHR